MWRRFIIITVAWTSILAGCTDYCGAHMEFDVIVRNDKGSPVPNATVKIVCTHQSGTDFSGTIGSYENGRTTTGSGGDLAIYVHSEDTPCPEKNVKLLASHWTECTITVSATEYEISDTIIVGTELDDLVVQQTEAGPRLAVDIVLESKTGGT